MSPIPYSGVVNEMWRYTPGRGPRRHQDCRSKLRPILPRAWLVNIRRFVVGQEIVAALLRQLGGTQLFGSGREMACAKAPSTAITPSSEPCASGVESAGNQSQLGRSFSRRLNQHLRQLLVIQASQKFLTRTPASQNTWQRNHRHPRIQHESPQTCNVGNAVCVVHKG